MHAVFIRAPVVERVGPAVEVLAQVATTARSPAARAPRSSSLVPSGALTRPAGARAVPARGWRRDRTRRSRCPPIGPVGKGVPDVRPFQVGHDQAQEGRRRQGPRQALRQADPSGRGGRPRGRRRPRHEPDAADDVPEGPRRVGAARHHRAGHQAGHRRARGRHLRADHLRGLRPPRRRRARSTCSPTTATAPGATSARRSRRTAARSPSRARWPGSSSARAIVILPRSVPTRTTSCWPPSTPAPRTSSTRATPGV